MLGGDVGGLEQLPDGGPAGWLGLRGTLLAGRATVVSPHLDDGIFSLGATISAASRQGASVRVVTVFAGEVGAEDAAGTWDARAGFRSAGEAATVRREEDSRACSLVGATPVWLPFRDQDYPPRTADDEVADALAAALRGSAVVLVPGWPLWHQDHRRVAELALRAAPTSAQVLRYAEQPYTMWTLPPPPEAEPRADGWTELRAGLRDRLAKVRACRAYTTQLRLMEPGFLRHLTAWEARHGGEHGAWNRS